MQRNYQEPEASNRNNPFQLDLHSQFYTIQGEGPFSGLPAVFIRLAGCNLQCPGCDTEYTATRERRDVADIAERCRNLFPGSHSKPRLVVITGGEPFRQDISELARELLERGYMVQVETNGTYAPQPHFPKGVHIVCSPKAPRVATGLIEYGIRAYKYVLKIGEAEEDGLPKAILDGKRPARPHDGFKGAVYVSPMDVQDPDLNKANVGYAAHVCMNHGFILNLQVHKLVGLP